MMTAEKGHQAAFQYLLSRGANFSIRDNQGMFKANQYFASTAFVRNGFLCKCSRLITLAYLIHNIVISLAPG